MKGHQYLESVLTSQVVSSADRSAMQTIRQGIEATLRSSFGWGPRIYYAGSYGKDTMLSAYHDLDIVIYFPSSTTETPKSLYSNVYGALQQGGYVLRQKDVAINLRYDGGLSVDVVPGRALDDTFLYANLYRSETDSRLQTSIKTHIDTIKNSGLRGAMRLMKLWNLRFGLNVRSFALELITIRALQGRNISEYDGKLITVFQYLRDHMETVRLVDPANSSNIISDAIPPLTKKRVAAQAQASLSAHHWEHVIW